MEPTTSTKCQCLPPDFTPPGSGYKRREDCLGPGSAGIGDYCENCSDNRCRRHAMEAAQKSRDLQWRHKTSRRKCKCAHDNIIGCESPGNCAGFGCGAQGFCDACESRSCTTQYINTSRCFKQISRVTGRYISTERATPRPPTSSRSNPPPTPADQHVMQTGQPHRNPSTSYQQPALPTTNNTKKPDSLYNNPSTLRPPAPPITDHAEQAAQPSGHGKPSTPYPQPHATLPATAQDPTEQPIPSLQDTHLQPAAEAEEEPQVTCNTTNTTTDNTTTDNTTNDDITGPFPASSDGTGGGINQRPCACLGMWTCKTGGMCEETVMFLEGDFCGMCEIFNCGRWEP